MGWKPHRKPTAYEEWAPVVAALAALLAAMLLLAGLAGLAGMFGGGAARSSEWPPRACNAPVSEFMTRYGSEFAPLAPAELALMLAELKAEGKNPAPSDQAFAAPFDELVMLVFAFRGCLVAWSVTDALIFADIVGRDAGDAQ